MTDDLDASRHREEVERWHADRVRRLLAPEGWLSLTGLWWLSPGANGVGSDPACDVVLPDGPGSLGAIDVEDGRVVARFDAPAGVVVDGAPAPPELVLRTDADPGGPTVLRFGTVAFHVIDRDGRLAVRVKDTRRAEASAAAFAGIDRFRVDARWRVVARFEPHPEGTTVLVPDVLGSSQTYRNPGVVAFELEGVELRLEGFLEPDEEELFLVFGDATNGTETFAGGRYLYAKPPDERGRVVLDFNRAYNPPCVFTEFATCVLPLPENRLPARIEAGERRYGEH